MKPQLKHFLAISILAAAAGCSGNNPVKSNDVDSLSDTALIAQGKTIFRSDTFGNEAFWTDTLHMNDVIASAVVQQAYLGSMAEMG